MATDDQTVKGPEIDEGYTHAEDVLADGELVEPESDNPPPPVTSEELKLKEEADEGKTESGKGEDKIKSLILISGAAVAVLGAIFAIAKKIKVQA